MTPEIIYVKKDDLYPLFGLAKDGKAYVRDDLPGIVKEFVREHEIYHLNDCRTDAWCWRELRANLYAACKHPLGFLATSIMSIAPYRLAYYWQRIKKHA